MFEGFDVFAVAPNGVKKLRELILQLAVQGKLVPQDPSDEPASVLLKKIATEKARLVAEGKIKKSEPLPPIEPEEVPFEVPSGWGWCPLGSLGEFLGGGTPSKSRSDFWDGEVPWVSPKDMKKDWIDGSIDTITEEAVSHSAVKLIPPRAVLFVVRGMILVHTFPVAITARTVTINQDMKALILHRAELAEYVAFAAKSLSDWILRRVQVSSHGTRRLESDVLSGFPIAVPPVTEQARILARVDQLMSLCDELERKYDAQQDQRQKLNAAALDTLLAADDETEFAAAWQRVCDSFDLLYDAPESVTKLRQAILQLAVMGKLVKQDPNDEPASVLLKKITADRKPISLPPIAEGEKRFDAPSSWVWIRMGTIVDQRLGKMLDKAKNKGSLFPYLRNTNVQWLRFDLSDVKEMRFEPGEIDEFEVKRGDLLVCEGGEPGRCAIWEGSVDKIMFQKAIHRLRPFGSIEPWFLLCCLWADAKSGSLEPYFTGATIKHFTGQQLARYSLALPPLAEQHRIVAKVDQLMSLCDELESKLTAARERAERLVGAVVGA